MGLERLLGIAAAGVAIGLGGVPAPAFAQAPDRVDYQGILRDASGQPMNGSVNLVLRIWASATSLDPADLLYQEAHTGVAVLDGVFQLEIGQGISTVGGFGAELFADPQRWLEVEAGGERLVPRQKFSSVGYAMRAERAGSADNLAGLTPGDVQRRVVGTCPAGQSIRAIGTDGNVVCEPDDDTTYTAGSGITLQGTTFSLADLAALQRRVSGTCSTNSSIRVVNQDGTVVCEPDTDANTTYQAGAGLDLVGTVFSIESGGVTPPMLAANAATNPSLATGAVDSRVVLDGSVVAGDLQADSVSAAEIAAGAVGTSEIANGAVTTDDVLDGTLTGSDVASASLPASVLANGAGGDFTNVPLNPNVTSAGVTLLRVDLDLPSNGLVIATASGYAVPIGGTVTMSCQIRVNDAAGGPSMNFDALNGASNPFGGTRAFGVSGAGTVSVSLFCDTGSAAIIAIVPAPQLTAVFVPTTY